MSKKPHTQYDKTDLEIEQMVNRQINHPPTSSDWLESALHKFAGCGYPHPDYMYCEWCDHLPEVRQAIEAHLSQNYRSITSIREAIGEDDTHGETCEECNNWDEGRNDLRADIRKALNLDYPQSKGGEND